MARKTFQRRPQPTNTAAGQRCHATAAAADCPQSPPLRCDPREVAGAMVYTGPPMQGNGPVLMENYLPSMTSPGLVLMHASQLLQSIIGALCTRVF